VDALERKTDEELFLLLWSGIGQVAWTELFRRWFPRLSSRFRQTGLQDGDAEELAQQVMMRLHRSLESGHQGYDPERPFKPYLRSIARNLLAEYFRRLRRDLPLESMDTGMMDTRLASPRSGDVLEELVEHDQQEAEQRLLTDALTRLDAQERQILNWYFAEGKTTRDIADALGCSPSKAWGLVKDLKAKLRRLVNTPSTNRRPD